MQQNSPEPRKKRLFKQAQNHKFVFNYDPDDPEQLHITVRHLGTPEGAILAFFNGTTIYDAVHKRFRTETEDYFVLWFWLNEGTKYVMIISAGPLNGGFYSSEED